MPHFPCLFHVMFHLLNSNNECSQQVFQTLVVLLSRIHALDKKPSDVRSGMIHSFVEFMFEPMLDLKVHMGLVTQFVTFAILVKKNVAPVNSSTLFSVSWMIFDMIVKSMVLCNKPANAVDRMHQFSADFPRLLKKLFVELRGLLFMSVMRVNASGGNGGSSSTSDEVANQALNVNMAMFLSDLICVYDRGVLCDVISQHLEEFSAQDFGAPSAERAPEGDYGAVSDEARLLQADF